MMFTIAVLPDRGRSHEARANGEGCGACGFGLASRAPGGLGSHCPAQLRGSVRQRAGGADESRGEKTCGIRELSDCGSFRLQKAVSRSKENAAVERREANALRHWACAARRSNVTPRLSALRSLTLREGRCPLAASEGKECRRTPRLARTGAAELWLLLAGCLTCESDARARQVRAWSGCRETRGVSGLLAGAHELLARLAVQTFAVGLFRARQRFLRAWGLDLLGRR